MCSDIVRTNTDTVRISAQAVYMLMRTHVRTLAYKHDTFPVYLFYTGIQCLNYKFTILTTDCVKKDKLLLSKTIFPQTRSQIFFEEKGWEESIAKMSGKIYWGNVALRKLAKVCHENFEVTKT